MGNINPPEKVKLICGILASEEELFDKITKELIEKFGPPDSKSHIINFNKHTSYYRNEMGDHIKRLFLSFENIICPSFIVDAKLITQELELPYTINNKRQINLDPGYISEGKLVLATTKNQQHRIYMDRGIFAEVTLRFVNKNFIPWEWTYRDYKTEEYINYFIKVRSLLRRQLGRRMTIRKRRVKKIQKR